jgi:tetratricopeptide (TPR) repeat protein
MLGIGSDFHFYADRHESDKVAWISRARSDKRWVKKMDQHNRDQLEFANKLIFVKKYDEADRILREVLESNSGKEEALIHLRRIELMSLLGKLAQIKEHYKNCAEINDDDGLSQICLVLTNMFWDPNSSAELMSQLQEIGKVHGPSAILFFALGFGAEQQGSSERAKYNYEQSLSLNQQWYPSLFGLSQVYYNMGDDAKGDQLFVQFELMAPFNVYGNFETHRRLSQEFLQLGRLDDAEKAIQALTNWWVDNKGFAPPEIQIYENLSIAQLMDKSGDKAEAEARRNTARVLTTEMLGGTTADENALYFVARILTEFGEEKSSFAAYKRVLQVAGENPSVVQKVGSHFLGSGQIAEAKELFEAAYDQHPDNAEIRFCLLVSQLKVRGVGVEEYLIGRERIRQLADGGDKVEFLSLLNALQARFSDDWDVQFHLADLYMHMGHENKAAHHYQRMYELDSKGQSSRLRYANFLMNQGEIERSMDILRMIDVPKGALSDVDAEIQWLRATYYDRKLNWEASLEMITPLLARDPWNITYVTHEILCLTGIRHGHNAIIAAQDHWARKLANNEESRVNWPEFSKDTAKISEAHEYQLSYARCKLQYLYMRGSENSLRLVAQEACRFDASKGSKELMKLINTNFDHPSIYWGLGLLYKELWQLEVASMWFEHALGLANIENRLMALVYVDLADCYVWRNVNLPKAVEFIKLSLDISSKTGQQDRRAMMIMGHALLLQGHVRQAQAYLDHMKEFAGEFEAQYLVGLVLYRNGHPLQANAVWKPLLKFPTEQMRDHRIKQEIFKYYFEKAPYAPRDLSKAN